MTTTRILRLLSAATLAACLGAAPAFAAAVSFVSVKGVDSGTCAAPTAPCRTFAYAYGQTSAGGDILAVDAGDYGPVDITKSISITGVPGAGIRDGRITVTAGPTDTVNLSGLTLEPTPLFSGVFLQGAGALTVKNCAIRNAAAGVYAGSTGTVLVEDVRVEKLSDGVYVAFDNTAVINRFSSSAANGSAVASFGAATIADSLLADSQRGIYASGQVFVTRTTITGSTDEGVFLGGVNSAGDNFIRGNTIDVNGALTNVGRQ